MTNLVLGWKVTPGGDPAYWLAPNPQPGRQNAHDLISIPSDTMATHTVILAQSGSGKSFFLGRLIEEILMRTKARCLVFDPNADFTQIHRLQRSALWVRASYDAGRRAGRLPHETDRDSFALAWNQLPIRIFTRRKLGAHATTLQIWWPDLSVDLLSNDLDPVQREELYHCHRFVQALAPLVTVKRQMVKRPLDLLDVAEQLSSADRARARSSIEEMFPLDRLAPFAASHFPRSLGSYLPIDPSINTMDEAIRLALAEAFLARSINQAAAAIHYVEEEMAHFYFATANQHKVAGILALAPPLRSPSNRLDVVDLPSLADWSTRQIIVNSFMDRAWTQARSDWVDALSRGPEDDKRVPLFIVIDEAHNLVPADPRNNAERALREQFRTVAAEGRKYGLFLILVSQRPEKLDPLVISECANKALMRLDSRNVLDGIVRLCGLEDIPIRTLEKCLDFGTGRVLLIGRWAGDHPTILYSAARRTLEGGRNLRPAYWATP